ncbi:hypothetical protein ACFX5K_00765 [Rickettsiales bacterium LUAb2]
MSFALFSFGLIAYNNPSIILKAQLRLERVHQMNYLLLQQNNNTCSRQYKSSSYNGSSCR